MALPQVRRDELRSEMDAGSVVVVDTMPASYFDKQHLPGARNIPGSPYEDVPALTAHNAPIVVPHKETAVVVYANRPCRNNEFVGAHLLKMGYTNVREYREGIEDWMSAGLPIESSEASS